MELHALQLEVATAYSTETAVPSISLEDIPPQAEPITLPETPVELVPQTPIELVCASPLEDPVDKLKDQIHVLIVDDNDINLKVIGFLKMR